MLFLNPLDALIPNVPFSFFSVFWVWVTSEARGSVSVRFGGSCQLSPFLGRGGGLARGLYQTPPPPLNCKPGCPRFRPVAWVEHATPGHEDAGSGPKPSTSIGRCSQTAGGGPSVAAGPKCPTQEHPHRLRHCSAARGQHQDAGVCVGGVRRGCNRSRCIPVSTSFPCRPLQSSGTLSDAPPAPLTPPCAASTEHT